MHEKFRIGKFPGIQGSYEMVKFKTSFLENPWKGGCLFPSEGAGYKGAFMMKGRIDRMSAPFKVCILFPCSFKAGKKHRDITSRIFMNCDPYFLWSAKPAIWKSTGTPINYMAHNQEGLKQIPTLRKAWRAHAVAVVAGRELRNMASHFHPSAKPWGWRTPLISVCK